MNTLTRCRRLSRIAHKHASLGIREDQYPIVYEHLFAAIAEDLGEAATEEIVAAWTEVYWLMADALIKLEKVLYAQQANDKPWSPWKLVAKEAVAADVMTFRFEPADDTPVTAAKPGQFVSVRVRLDDGLRQCRQYTLSSKIESTYERVITTKIDAGGEVSPWMHQKLQIGDVIELSNPYGDLVIEEQGAPIVIATAGIGCTPSASALTTLAQAGSDREVVVLHADTSEQNWALQQEMRESVQALPNASMHVWLEEPGESATDVQTGYMNLDLVELPEEAVVYLCGPLPFMKAVRSQAIDAGVPPRNIHYEVFGPDLWIMS